MNAETPGSAWAVRFSDVTVTLDGTKILEQVSADVPQGSCTAIVGPNGAGKTTLLLSLLGHIPYQGKIDIAATADGRQARIGFVPQRLSFDRGLPLTVAEFLAMGVQRLPLWFGVRPEILAGVRTLLASVRAEAIENRVLGALSGGELQRVLVCLALQQDPDLLILDEPAAGVDFHGESLFCEVLENLRQARGFTQIMVSHDLGTVTHHATHAICLNRRVAAVGPTAEVLTPENLMAVFGRHRGLAHVRMFPPTERETCCSRCSRCHDGPAHD